MAIAQTGTEPFISHVRTSPQGEGLGLELFFLPTDGQSGRSSGQQTATLTLQSQPDITYDVNITPSGEPYFVLFLVGTEHESAETLDLIKDRAAEIVGSAQGNANFALIEYGNFVNRTRPIFTSVPTEIVGAIDGLSLREPSGEGSACLFDAVVNGLGLMEDTLGGQPQSPRGMVILGSENGLDVTAGVPGCGSFDRQSATNFAQDVGVAIDVINFSPNAGAEDDPLNLLAEFTGGSFSPGAGNSFGSSNNSDLFEDLSQQQVARAIVFPEAGPQFGTLTFEENGGLIRLNFSFNAPQSFELPSGPPSVDIVRLIYDEENDRFIIDIGITNPAEVGNLIVQVWDDDTNTLELEQRFAVAGSVQTIELETDSFEPGRGYRLEVYPVTLTGNTLVDEEGETIFAVQEFVYTPPEAPPPEILVSTVSANTETGNLTIVYEILNGIPGSTLAGFFNNEQNTIDGRFAQIPVPSLPSGEIEVTLPITTADQRLEEPLSYTLVLELIDGNDQKVAQAEPYEFDYMPILPPRFFGRIFNFLRNQIWFVFVAIGLIAAFIGYAVYTRQQRAKQTGTPLIDQLHREMSQPPSQKPVAPKSTSRRQAAAPKQTSSDQNRSKMRAARGVGSQIKPKSRTVRVEIVKAQDTTKIGTQIRVPKIPFTLGRQNFNHDQYISSTHLEIGVDEKGLFIKDLDSSNGTFIGERKLLPGKPHYLKGEPPDRVRLGKKTVIQFLFNPEAFKE